MPLKRYCLHLLILRIMSPEGLDNLLDGNNSKRCEIPCYANPKPSKGLKLPPVPIRFRHLKPSQGLRTTLKEAAIFVWQPKSLRGIEVREKQQMATVNWKFLESALQDGQLTGHPKNWQHRSVATVNYFIYLVNRRGKQGMDVAQLCNEWPSGWNDFGADFKELSSKFREISKSTVLTYGKWLYDKELIGILRTESDSYRGEKNLYVTTCKHKSPDPQTRRFPTHIICK